MEKDVDALVFLLIAVAVLALAARRLKVPYPITFVVGGLIVALIPGLPKIELRPDLVFLLFLPPLLFPAALLTSWRDFYANIRPISLLAVGLVLFTMLAVGLIAHTLTGLPLAAAFALGAIVSPPDAVAAVAITHRLGVPRRIVTILEGESLVNDASALVALRFAQAAIISGTFSLGSASIQFVLVTVGGVLIGLGIGFASAWVQRLIDDPPVQITLSVLTPFATYLTAERFGVSGVLAVVVAGLYVGWKTPDITDARVRLRAYPFWEMVVFLLNGFLFIMIGLQLPSVLAGIKDESISRLVFEAALLSLAVIVVRIIWVFPATYLPRLWSRGLRKQDPYPSWKNVTIVAWTGMRGGVSLAAALALPPTLGEGGAAFPGRNLILFYSFCIILATLVCQGLSLPFLIKWLNVHGDDDADREEREARIRANRAAKQELIEIEKRQSVDIDLVRRLRAEYEERIVELELAETGPEAHTPVSLLPPYRQLQQEALNVERRTILQLRNQHVINDVVMRRIELDLDLAESRLRLRSQASD